MGSDKLEILIIDDDSDVRATAVVDLEVSLRELDIESKVRAVATLEEGVQILAENYLDLVVVDLRLDNGQSSGNQIIQQIIETRVVPMIVFSGFPQELDETYRDHKLIAVAQKKRVEWIVEIVKEWRSDGVFGFFSEHGFVNKLLRDVLQRTMWTYFSKCWDGFRGSSEEVLAQTGGRIAATLIHDVLASSPEYASNTGEVKIHHGEIYIFDTPRRQLGAGDILRIEGRLFVVLSPTCDLIGGPGRKAKALQVLLAACHDFVSFARRDDEIRRKVENVCGSDRDKKAIEAIEKLMRQDWKNPAGRYFYLPPFASFGGGVIDFLDLRTESLESEDLRKKLVDSRVVALNREVAAEIATRFGRHMIRLGQAPYQSEPLMNALGAVWGRNPATTDPESEDNERN